MPQIIHHNNHKNISAAPQQAGLFYVLLTTAQTPVYLTLLNSFSANRLKFNQLIKLNNNPQLNPMNTLLNNLRPMKTPKHRSRHPQPGSAVAPQPIQGTPRNRRSFRFRPLFLCYFLLEEQKKVRRTNREDKSPINSNGVIVISKTTKAQQSR